MQKSKTLDCNWEGLKTKPFSFSDYPNFLPSPQLLLLSRFFISFWTDCQSLKIEYNPLFVLKPLEFIISIIKESYSLEEKLTSEKEKFYKNLEIDAKEKFKKIT